MKKTEIFIPRKRAFERKLKHLQKEGAQNLHIVSDFDKTLTKAYVYGKRVHSSYALIREGKYCSPEYVAKAYALHDKYYPYEISPILSLTQKKKKMLEWWTAHYKLMIRSGITRQILQKVATKMTGRKGLSGFFKILAQKKIPILIFSSGQGDVIKRYLENKRFLTKNVHLLSNLYMFDKKGKATCFNAKEMIHVFNKNEIEVKHHKYHKEVEQRKNVILLGDSLGDLGMIAGIHHHVVLKIGFLNETVSDLRKEYAKHFDMLVLNDGGMGGVNEVLRRILHSKK